MSQDESPWRLRNFYRKLAPVFHRHHSSITRRISMRVRLMTLLLGAVLCGTMPFNSGLKVAAQVQSASDARLDKLPPDLRQQGQAILDQRDDRQRARLAGEMARRNSPEAIEFLLTVLAADASPQVRSGIIDRLGRYSRPEIRQALESRVTSDPDTGVALLA